MAESVAAASTGGVSQSLFSKMPKEFQNALGGQFKNFMDILELLSKAGVQQTADLGGQMPSNEDMARNAAEIRNSVTDVRSPEQIQASVGGIA